MTAVDSQSANVGFTPLSRQELDGGQPRSTVFNRAHFGASR